jgi:O-antigen/teichoic acid export membrane protein
MSVEPESVPWHRRLFVNTVINGASMVLAIVVGFFLTPFLVHHLGVSAYGLWGLLGAFSVSAGYLSLADLGLQQTAVKLIAEHEGREEWDEIGRVAKASIYLFLAIGATAGLAMLLFTLFALEATFNFPARLSHDVHVSFLLFSAQIPLELLTLPFAGVLEGRQRYGVLRSTEIVRTCVWVGIAVVALLHGGGLVALAAGNLVAAVIGLVLTVIAARRSLPARTLGRARPTRQTFRRIFSFSVNLFVARVTGVLYRQMDRVIIAVALTSFALGQYEIASKLELLAALTLAFLASAVMPAASKLSATEAGRGRLTTMFLEGTKYTLVIAIPITVALMVWADALIRTWVGRGFEPSIGYARLFLVWVLFTATNTVGLTMIVGMGYVRQVMLYGLVSTVCNLAVSIALVPVIGVSGVILGTIVGYGIVWYPYMRIFLGAFDLEWSVFWRRTIAPVLIVCLPWTVVLLLVHAVVTPERLLGTMVVLALSVGSAWLLLLRLALRSEERRVLMANVRSIFGAA